MTLFIAIILLNYTNAHWAWYLVAIVIWLVQLYFKDHAVIENLDRIIKNQTTLSSLIKVK